MTNASKIKKRSSPEPSPAFSLERDALISWATFHRDVLLQALVLVLAGWWVYYPVLHGDWLWEDDFYVTDNPLLNDPSRLWKIWFHPGSLIEYYPIQATAQYIQWQLWRDDTFGYHVTNLVLHLISSLLIWRLLSKLGLRLAWLGGLLFAVHPIMVESVAWISEFKNTLALPPFLLAVCYYLDYDEHGRESDYLRAVGLFLVAMLCKISMAPFPVVILLYAWWKRGRIDPRDVRASLPFFAISLVLGLLTHLCGIWYRELRMDHPDEVPMGGLLSRLACAGLSFSFYLSKLLWPVGLLPVYPKWKVDPPSQIQFLPWVLLAIILYGSWENRKGWGRHVLLGLGFFLITLAPFLGLNEISYMSFTWVMDHMAYIPAIGIIGLAVAGVQQLEVRLVSATRLIRCLTAAIVVTLAWKSHAYASYFIDEEALWTRTLERDPQSLLGYNNLGNALLAKNRPEDAIPLFEQGLRMDPALAEIHVNLGTALLQTGHVPEGLKELQKAIDLNPRLAPAYYNRGLALAKQGKNAEACEQFEQALKINPYYAMAHSDLGIALFQMGRIPEAIDHFEAAVRLDPGNAIAHGNLGSALSRIGHGAEAIEQFETALRIDPNYTDAQNNLIQLQAAFDKN